MGKTYTTNNLFHYIINPVNYMVRPDMGAYFSQWAIYKIEQPYTYSLLENETNGNREVGACFVIGIGMGH